MSLFLAKHIQTHTALHTPKLTHPPTQKSVDGVLDIMHTKFVPNRNEKKTLFRDNILLDFCKNIRNTFLLNELHHITF
jgi:hypothetical protein